MVCVSEMLVFPLSSHLVFLFLFFRAPLACFCVCVLCVVLLFQQARRETEALTVYQQQMDLQEQRRREDQAKMQEKMRHRELIGFVIQQNVDERVREDERRAE